MKLVFTVYDFKDAKKPSNKIGINITYFLPHIVYNYTK